MVKILSNGEIVNDSDPRAAKPNVHIGNNSTPTIRSTNSSATDGTDATMHSTSIFSLVNRKMLDAGIPRMHFGSWVVEPIAAVGALLATLLLGFSGFFLALLLYAAVKFSEGGLDPRPNSNVSDERQTPSVPDGGSARRRFVSAKTTAFSGKGHRLDE